MLVAFVQGILDVLGGLLSFIIAILPKSPFVAFDTVFIENKYLQWLAWIIPFPQIIAVLQAWLTAITAFYIYSILLRWIKAIQ